MDLEDAARELLTPLGYEVLELNVSGKGKKTRVLLRIDRIDEAAVAMDDVSLVSNVFSLELDRLDSFNDPYKLEVESPGPERPLRTARHFERFRDLLVKVTTRSETFKGRVVGVEGETIDVEVGDDVKRLNLSDIEQARLAEWPDTPR